MGCGHSCLFSWLLHQVGGSSWYIHRVAFASSFTEGSNDFDLLNLFGMTSGAETGGTFSSKSSPLFSATYI